MNIAGVKTALATQLATMTVTGQPVPASSAIFAVASDFVASSLPAIVMHLAPVPNKFNATRDEFSAYLYKFTLAINLFVGLLEEPLDQLITRTEPYPLAITDVLFKDITLGGACVYIGNDQNGVDVGSGWVGPMRWADGYYYGYQHLLPVAIERTIPTSQPT